MSQETNLQVGRKKIKESRKKKPEYPEESQKQGTLRTNYY